MRRILLVAKRDYLAAVKNKGFLIGLIVAPLLFGGAFLGVALLNRPETKEQRIAVVDRSGIAADAVVSALEERNRREMFDKASGRQVQPRYVFETHPPQADHNAQRLALSERVRRGELLLFLEIGAEALKPGPLPQAGAGAARRRVSYYSNASGFNEIRRWFDGPVNEGLRSVRLRQLGVDPARIKEALGNVPAERMTLVSRDAQTGKIQDARPRNELESFIVPFAMIVLLMMVVMVGSSPLLGAVAEDKMQRVHEMLLVAASPFELMLGKVVASLGVSLTSSVFYIVGAVLALQGMALIGLVPFPMLPWFFAYLIADVLMLSAMAAGLGSACGTPQDAQSLAVFLVAPVVVPSMLILPVLQQPNGALATALSFVPPFTPMLMLLRQALPGGVPAWQPWVGLAGVVACTLLITWGAARVFRVGILLQGNLPRMNQLLRLALRG